MTTKSIDEINEIKNPHHLQHIIAKFNRNYDQLKTLEFVIHEICSRMIERLEYIKFNPINILDLGSGLNIDAARLQQKFINAHIYTIDCAMNQLLQTHKPQSFIQKLIMLLTRKNNIIPICANASELPIASQSIDLVWANLLLPYISDIPQLFKEIRRVLRLGGTFLISGLGVDSLKQIRQLGLRTYDFPDMHLIGDILVSLGFTNPVTDVEHIHLEYDNINQLLTDIRLVGVGGNIINSTIPHHHQMMQQKLNPSTAISPHKNENNHTTTSITRARQIKSLPPFDNNKINLTLEVFYAHAWKDKINIDLEQDQHIIEFVSKKYNKNK